jgi:hypothetical protein
MSFELDLQPEEVLIFHDWIKGPRKPMSLAVSERALFIAREQHLRMEAYYMHRVPITDVEEVSVRKIRGPALWIASSTVFLCGIAFSILLAIGQYNNPPSVRVSPVATGGSLVMIALGIAMPFYGKGRRVLEIRTKRTVYRWKPAIFDNRSWVKRLQEDFLWACRNVDVPTRRLDIVTTKEVASFWTWFTSYTRSAVVDADAIRRRLKKLCEDIDVEICQDVSGQYEFIITANWTKDLFPVVEDIVKLAPVIPGWTISAFRPRGVFGKTFMFDDAVHQTDEVFFIPYTDGFELAIRIFVVGDAPELRSAAFPMISTLLGEYDSLTKVRYYDFGLIEDVDVDDLRHISELPQCVDGFMRSTAN